MLEHDALTLLLVQRPFAVAHGLGRIDYGELGIAENDEVERRSPIPKVVRARGDVEAGDRHSGLRMEPANDVGYGHRRRVLKAGGAGNDHEVGHGPRQTLLDVVQEGVAVHRAGVADRVLQVQHAHLRPSAPQHGEHADQLGLDARAGRPAPAVERCGENDQRRRDTHVEAAPALVPWVMAPQPAGGWPGRNRLSALLYPSREPATPLGARVGVPRTAAKGGAEAPGAAAKDRAGAVTTAGSRPGCR